MGATLDEVLMKLNFQSATESGTKTINDVNDYANLVRLTEVDVKDLSYSVFMLNQTLSKAFNEMKAWQNAVVFCFNPRCKYLMV